MRIYQVEQGSAEWHKLRAGCITWTKLKGTKWKITTATWLKSIETTIFTLIWEEFFPPVPIFENEAMLRGKFLEKLAREEFEKISGKKVEEVWFIKNSKFSDKYWEWLWLSPDWIIQENGIIIEATEFKCFMPTNYVRTFLTDEIPDENFDQVLTYFLVIPTLQKLHFAIYNPDSYIEENKIKIIVINRNDILEELKEAEEKLFEFRKKWIEYILLYIKQK